MKLNFSKNSVNNKYKFGDSSFKLLMRKRINNILLICSTYDAFILEEDGRIDEQIFNEYVSLNLRYPPNFIQTSSADEALEILKNQNIDLIITMLSGVGKDSIEVARLIKEKYPKKPIVVLTPFSREMSLKLYKGDFSFIDYFFSWLGNADILLAIIKLIEDRMNVKHDVEEVGVQIIILVEDSVRFYSSYLPNMYKLIFKQSKQFMTEGLNEHQQMLRLRGRPKILLATNFEDAISLYNEYKNSLLGIISDISFKRNGIVDKQAGIKLCKKVRKDDKYMPFLFQSSDTHYRKVAEDLDAGFINKNSKTLSLELRNYINDNFAFGNFVFINPKTSEEICRVKDLKSLQEKIFTIPDDSLKYHIERNHISKWLNARALFPIANLFKQFSFEDFKDLDEVRRFLFDNISDFRLDKGRGIIAKFYSESFDKYFIFARTGDGSIGGKARGLAFLDTLIKKNNLIQKYDDIIITIPRTVVLTTDVFDEFMEKNNLYKVALSDTLDDGTPITNEYIMQKFVEARLPLRIHKNLYAFIAVVNNPIAIRSSSLLEDSHYQPFAGIYSTYMIPNVKDNKRLMIELLSDAIKCVYASVYYKNSKAYMSATSNVIDEEKMGIILQEVCGQKYGDRFYPSISGVARSLNFYPIEPEKTEDGIANIALGLGKYIVDGGQTLRFSPKYPKKIIQLSSTDMAVRETQKYFYALDLKPESFKPTVDDGYNILNLKINEAEKDNSLKHLSSTYDYLNNVITEGTSVKGKKIITFADILKHNCLPLSEIISDILTVGQKGMSNPVEIEFAMDINTPKGQPKIFNVLQIRPIVDNKQTINENLKDIPFEDTIISSSSALGNGIIDDIYDFIYVKPDSFKPANTQDIAMKVEKINDSFLKENKNYIIVGPGRWGSTDPWLGIPVKWSQISAARLIIESGLENYRIDPSQGTHFFQNLTSLRIGYFTINPFVNDGFYNIDYLSGIEPFYEDEYIKHIKFKKPLIVKIDGKKSIGVVMKPKE
ncbi:MAG: phosphoenolpyruvate synthase [Bacteroidales bacterium]|nr:phosphoenolpyruvate synthase [Bacteroidales bacterium]